MNRLAETRPSPARSVTRGAVAALLCLGLAAAAFALFAPGARKASAGIDRCTAPESLTDFRAPLPHTTQRLAGSGDLVIVALGSSSTWGTGASRREYAYPHRLAALLQARFPTVQLRA